jgi:hypothetical protein
MIRAMFIKLRAWWCYRFVKREAWPSDIAEYVFRSGVKTLERANLSPQQQNEIAITELNGVLTSDHLSPELRGDMLEDALKRLAKIPLEHCTNCERPVFTHEATMIEGQPGLVPIFETNS